MEEQVKAVDTAELLESYRELLKTVETLPLRISGNSMAPFLVHGRDTVFLTAVKRPLGVGDIALYQRDSGAYVLHRICAVEQNGRYTMVGDAQTAVERGIRKEQIFAVVCRAIRKGKEQGPGSFWWEFFEKVWVRVIWLRPCLQRMYGGARNVLGRRRK